MSEAMTPAQPPEPSETDRTKARALWALEFTTREEAIELIARALATARHEATLAERERCAKLASRFPAATHGNLPSNPSECAKQVANEIASAIRSASVDRKDER